MERDANYLLVGTVALSCLAALIMFFTWLFSGMGGGERARYSILFQDSVSGLNVNSAVEYQGVRVGKVIAIVLDADKPKQVRVDIEVAAETPIRDNTRVELGLQGITGLSRIELLTPDAKGGPPENIAGIPYPVLRGDGRQITKLFEEMPRIAANIGNIAERINNLLDERTAAELQRAVREIAGLSADLRLVFSPENREHLSATLANTAQASEAIAGMSARAERTAEAIEALAEDLRASLGKNQRYIDRFSQQGLDELLGLAAESRHMARDIRALAERLEEDPSQLIYKPQSDGVPIAP